MKSNSANSQRNYHYHSFLIESRMKIQPKTLFILLLSFTTMLAFPQEKYYNVHDHISETGKTITITKQLQSLIDECSTSGGGTIYFPPGEYLTGTIIIKDNTYLEISAGATLYGSTSMQDYYHDGLKSLIYANGLKIAVYQDMVPLMDREIFSGEGKNIHIPDPIALSFLRTARM